VRSGGLFAARPIPAAAEVQTMSPSVSIEAAAIE
jgi:hypothetical protein